MAFAVFMIVAGLWLDRAGLRLIASIGGILAGAGMIIAGLTQSVLGITIGFGLVVGAATASRLDFAPGEMLRTPQFYLLWLMFCFAASAGLLIIGHLAKISQIQGGITWGFILVAVLAVANASGRILAGWISDKLGRTNTMLIVFSIQAANMFLFASYGSVTLLLVGSILTGLAYGALLSLFPSVTFDYFGLKNAGINYGLVFSAWGAAALIGPIIGGRAADLTGGYGASYMISGILLLIAAAISFVTRAPAAKPGLAAAKQQ